MDVVVGDRIMYFILAICCRSHDISMVVLIVAKTNGCFSEAGASISYNLSACIWDSVCH